MKKRFLKRLVTCRESESAAFPNTSDTDCMNTKYTDNIEKRAIILFAIYRFGLFVCILLKLLNYESFVANAKSTKIKL